MDSYSGSEPRKFISFHLGKENVGQPQQTSCEPESETNDWPVMMRQKLSQPV